MGKTDSGKAGEIGKCRESMSAQQTESGKMGSGIQKQEGLTRTYRVKKIKYKYIKALRQPGGVS